MKKKEKKLTAKHLAAIEKHSHWMEIKSIEVKCAKLELLNIKLRAQLEMKESEAKTGVLEKQIGDKIISHKGTMKIIADKLKIKGKWSFDPLTGEVKED